MVEAELGCTPRHHSFPFGRSTPLLRAQVRQLGFDSACADRDEPWVGRGCDPYWLGRVYPCPSLTLLRYRTNGMDSGLQRLLGGAVRRLEIRALNRLLALEGKQLPPRCRVCLRLYMRLPYEVLRELGAVDQFVVALVVLDVCDR